MHVRRAYERKEKANTKSPSKHRFAGEEGGLLGSLDIADLYVQRNVDIHAMIEMVSSQSTSATSSLEP